jgi:hypothetical protein
MEYRFFLITRRAVMMVLFFFCLPAALVQAQNRDIQAIRPGLDASIEDMRRGVRTHTGSLIGGVVFPPVWLVGTALGSTTTIRSAEQYRDRIMTVQEEDPLPELRGARRWHIAGVAGHGVAAVGLTSLVVLAVANMDPQIDVTREAGVAGGVMAGGLVVGLVGTTVGTWRARNTTLRFHLAVEGSR